MPPQISVTRLDEQAWDYLVSAAAADVYYRRAYVRAYEKAGHGQALGLLIAVDETRFLAPLLLRPLCELPFAKGSSGFDAITPYGYGGLLRLSGNSNVGPETMRLLWSAMRKWCADSEVVSVMLRLHPLLGQVRWFGADEEDVSLRYSGQTIAYDLAEEWDTERESLRWLSGRRRSDIKTARKHLKVTWASGHLDGASFLPRFREIYEARMDELRASSFYYFPLEYYTELQSGLNGDVDIAIAWFRDKAVGGALVMAGQEFAHDHLTGATELGREYSADTLLVVEAAAWARRRGCRWMHVGGGRHGAPDTLFRFKRSFGGQLFQYAFAAFVSDPVRYRELTAMRSSHAGLPPRRPRFFPEYRA